ncbi:MAG TPA: ABC transporter ATP-binding protein [Devosiaceae bacterium]|jgi:heme-transporting ATPase
MTALLRCTDLAAHYGGRTIFTAASLSLGAGAYALQGANGSGKSTLLRLLAGARQPTRGTVLIAGTDLDLKAEAARLLLSYVPDESPVYPFMTGREFLQFVAAAKRTTLGRAVQGLVSDFVLQPHLDTRFDAMSLGTQKKLLLAAAWIGEPRVMLMDEPSNGLDQATRDILAESLRATASTATVLYATHDADFIAATGASVITMNQIVAPA